MDKDIVLPGQPLSQSIEGCRSGHGTFVRDGKIYSSLFGKARKDNEQPATISVSTSRPTLSVSALPTPGSLITGQVTRFSRRDATLTILTIDGIPVPIGSEFIGVIRIDDVRETEKDKIKIWNCFRGGDIVRARVVSLGDSRNYFLSTAEDSLGVVSAISRLGRMMVPSNWEQMMDPVSGEAESRKVAGPLRPQPLNR